MYPRLTTSDITLKVLRMGDPHVFESSLEGVVVHSTSNNSVGRLSFEGNGSSVAIPDVWFGNQYLSVARRNGRGPDRSLIRV